MSFYVIINSNENLEYFPDNQPYKFKTHLAKPLDMTGKWKVALSEIDFIEKLQNPNIYVCCDLCGFT